MNSVITALAQTWGRQGRLADLQAGSNRTFCETLISRIAISPRLQHLAASLTLYKNSGESAFNNPSFNPDAGFIIDIYRVLELHTANLFAAVNATTNEIPVEAQTRFIRALYNFGEATDNHNILELFKDAVSDRGIYFPGMKQQDAAEFMTLMHTIFGFSEHSEMSLSIKREEQLMRIEESPSGQKSTVGFLDVSTAVDQQEPIIRLPTNTGCLQETISQFGQLTTDPNPDPHRERWTAEHRAQWGLTQHQSIALQTTTSLVCYEAPQQLILQSNLTGQDRSGRFLGLGEDRHLTTEGSQMLLTDVQNLLRVPIQDLNGVSQDVPYRVQSVVLRGSVTSDAGHYMTVDLTGTEPMIRHDEVVQSLTEYLIQADLLDFSLADMCMLQDLAPYLFVMARVDQEPDPIQPTPEPPAPAPSGPAPSAPAPSGPAPSAPAPSRHPPTHQRGLKLGIGQTVRELVVAGQQQRHGRLLPTQGVQAPAIRLLGPAHGSSFSDIYEPQHSTGRHRMASLNAGDRALYVGGATINRQFEEVLFPPRTANGFADYHKKILALPLDHHGFIVPDLGLDGSDAAIEGVKHTLGMPAEGRVGPMFIHIFDEAHCPNGNPSNKAMLYIVPPRGSEHNDPDSFLRVVARTAEHMVMLAHEYNMRALMAGRETLDRLRVCRFSSGNYAFIDPATGLAIDGRRVANAIHQGITQGVANAAHQDGACLIEMIEYEDGAHGLFSGADIRHSDAQ